MKRTLAFCFSFTTTHYSILFNFFYSVLMVCCDDLCLARLSLVPSFTKRNDIWTTILWQLLWQFSLILTLCSHFLSLLLWLLCQDLHFFVYFGWRNDICTTIFVQLLYNFLSYTHIIFLFSLFLFLSPKSCTKIVVQISLLFGCPTSCHKMVVQISFLIRKS